MASKRAAAGQRVSPRLKEQRLAAATAEALSAAAFVDDDDSETIVQFNSEHYGGSLNGNVIFAAELQPTKSDRVTAPRCTV